MSRPPVTGATVVAGVAGAPVRHSLSPLIQNAWLEAAGIDGIYVPFAPPADGFDAFVSGLRGGTVRGVNVTIPFKEQALACATSPRPAPGRRRRRTCWSSRPTAASSPTIPTASACWAPSRPRRRASG